LQRPGIDKVHAPNRRLRMKASGSAPQVRCTAAELWR